MRAALVLRPVFRIFVRESKMYVVNPIDLIILLTLAVAVWTGWRRGFVLQVCSLAGLVAAIWIALRCGATVGGWLRLDPAIAAPGGFVAVFVAALLLVAVGARLLRGFFRFAGFGVPDIVLGIAVAAVKFLLLLSVLFAAFDRFDADRRWVSRETIEASRGYEPVKGLSERVFP